MHICKNVNLSIVIKTHSSMSAAKKQKKTHGTQVCYLLVLQCCQIQPSVSPKLLSRFLPNLYILCLTHTQLHISNLKEIASAILEILHVPEFSLHFSLSSHKITNIFKSRKHNLLMFRFILNFEHQQYSFRPTLLYNFEEF